MRSTKATRWLSGTLAALMLAQGMCLPAGAAGWWNNWRSSSSQTSQAMPLSETQNVQLQSGSAVIPSNANEATVKQILFDTLVVNKEGVDPQSLDWEYECEGKNGLLTNDAWGSVDGFTSDKKGLFGTTTYTHPALAANEDKSYQVRLAGTDTEVTLTKVEKLSSSITLNEGCTVALPYDENAQVDYAALKQNLFNALVASSTPELTLDDVTIEYYAQAKSGSWGGIGKEWMPLEGGTKNMLTYPAISAGEQQIRISYGENETYFGTSAEATVNIAERPEASIQVNSNPTVRLAVDKNLELDTDKLYQDIFNAIVATSTPELTLDDVTITYYAEAETGSLGSLGHAWVPLEGGKSGGLNYPAIPAGTQQVRISWAGNQNYAPTTLEVNVNVKEREQVQFNLNDGPYEVGMVFNAQQGYDYATTAKAIYDAVVASTTPAVDFANVTLEFSKTGTIFKPLDQTNFGTSFGVDEWKIKISVADTQTYRGNSVIVDVTTTDNRIASAVVLKEGVSFTYNKEPAVMKQAIFDNVIDWENSTLPDKETLTVDDFDIEYKAKLTDAESGVDLGLEDLKDLFGKIPGMDDFLNNDILTQWVPLEGKEYSIGNTTLGKYPQIGAGENQQIRISYNGNADYRPSGDAEGTVTVNKAKVSVKVNSTNIYADEQLPDDFITTDPDDKFDIYTIYAGITSNVTTGIYLDLPDRYSNSTFLKVIDEALKLANQKTLTEMMNEGVTVGELREFFSTEGLLDTLAKLNIDTGTFGQILTVINKMPGIMDSVRVAFGTPSRAGLYTVAAVTDNKNYETGVGIGFLLSKMRFSGPKLTWNDEIPNGKLTAEEAKNFDFGATLSYDGDVTIDQSSVHYLYSGFTSKWRVYSSTTTPPTEPGRYVVTVCILGGNYMAAPITRSFQITK